MEFHQKLQELRKARGLTQEELAEALYVSRTAVSKWELGRGYPNIDSLKAIAAFFSITVDALLSGEELLNAAEADVKQKEMRLRDPVFGLLDLGSLLLLFLPVFGQRATDGGVQSVSLLSLTEIAPYLRLVYFALIIGIAAMGALTLVLQFCNQGTWIRYKSKLSILLNGIGVLVFVISLQPYAAIFLLLFLAVKVLMAMKWA